MELLIEAEFAMNPNESPTTSGEELVHSAAKGYSI